MSFPSWVLCDSTGTPKEISEVLLAEELRSTYGKIWCVHGKFYTESGECPEEKFRSILHNMIKEYFPTKLADRTQKILRALQNEFYHEPPGPDLSRVYFLNGFYDLEKKTFTPETPLKKEIVLHRLKARYDLEAPKPERFLSYLKELLYPEDILTMQEYLGYCLVPCTKAQKMLFLVGDGGEGKSVLGGVLWNIFGSSMATGSMNHLFSNRFAVSSLEEKLLFLDDDLTLKGFEETETMKTLVTAMQPIQIEEKGKPLREARIYTRLMAFGNGAPQLLFDRSEGAYRRQIILSTQPKRADRSDDPLLPDKLKQETEGIVLWMIEGLHRLIQNNWQLTISKRAQENLEQVKRENCNVLLFLDDPEWVSFDPDGEATSADLFLSYNLWCHDNGFHVISRKSFFKELARLGRHRDVTGTVLRESNHIWDGSTGRKVRGYKGIRLIKRPIPSLEFVKSEKRGQTGRYRDAKGHLKMFQKPHRSAIGTVGTFVLNF